MMVTAGGRETQTQNWLPMCVRLFHLDGPGKAAAQALAKLLRHAHDHLHHQVHIFHS